MRKVRLTAGLGLRASPDAYALDGSSLFGALGTGATICIERAGVSICAIWVERRVHGLLVILVARENSSSTNAVDFTLAFHAFAAGAAIGVKRTGERNCRNKSCDDQKCFDELHDASLSSCLRLAVPARGICIRADLRP